MVFAIITTAVIVALLAVILAVALATAAGWADDQRQDHGGLMSVLGTVKSPSGKPFFGGPGAVSALTQSLEELWQDLGQRGGGGALETLVTGPARER